jgi:hypothetical protein
MRYIFALTMFAGAWAHGASCNNLPKGAEALGYNTQLFYDQPQLSEVSTSDADSTSKWYPGSFSHLAAQNLATREHLSTAGSQLAISLGGGVSSETYKSKVGALPFLNGSQGFYVEFGMRLSSNDPDHFSGLYLDTVEHNLAKDDHFSTDPDGFERWTEMDVSETGFDAGNLDTFINWTGKWPLYTRWIFNSYGHDAPVDFTVEHRYGLSYDPGANVLQWYIDDVPTWKTVATESVIKNFHYYLVMEASSHGANKPYQMFISYVTAYTK